MGLVRVEEYNFVLKVFDEMFFYGFLLDYWIYFILIRCYCKKIEVDEGKRFLDCMI